MVSKGKSGAAMARWSAFVLAAVLVAGGAEGAPVFKQGDLLVINRERIGDRNANSILHIDPGTGGVTRTSPLTGGGSGWRASGLMVEFRLLRRLLRGTRGRGGVGIRHVD